MSLYSIRNWLVAAITVCILCTFFLSYKCTMDLNEDGYSKPRRRSVDNAAGPPDRPLLETYLVVAIMSSPNESDARSVIRNTWLKLSAKGPSVIRHVFPIGTKILSESERSQLDAEQREYGDLGLINSLEESYQNLAKKTLNTMEYVYQNYKFQYLLKVDSDSFVRLGAMIKSLKDIQHPRLYWGFLDGRAKPIRKGKWKEADWMLCDRYLPYHLGGGYVLSTELVRFLATNARLFKMYKNEDVSVGAWLAGLDIKYLHDPRFDTEWISRGCNNEYLITHKKKPEEMEKLFKNLVDRRFLCEKEFRVRYSYVYDMSALPSDCCKRLNGSSIP